MATESDANGCVIITELPPVGSRGGSFLKYAEWLKEEKCPYKLLEDRCVEDRPYFKVQFKKSSADGAAAAAAAGKKGGKKKEGLLESLQLVSEVKTNNMWLFDADGKIKRYESAAALLAEWCEWRLARYADRREHTLARLEREACETESKVRFVTAVASGALRIGALDEEALLRRMEGESYARRDGAFDYLLNMPARSLTTSRVAALERELAALRERLAALRAQTARQLWEADLDALEKLL